jgi:DNA-binding transcriptional ArsR family regulator
MSVDSITKVANLIGESGRIRMLSLLLDGDGHSASELAMAAGVSAQTASSHLAKLLDGGLVVFESKGRQRLFRLANTDVAVAIESLGALASNAAVLAMPAMRLARTCYDHLAGVLAIALRDELLKRDVLRSRENTFLLTESGERFFRGIDIDVEELRGLRRPLTRKCLDWTERHHHVGGALGAALLTRFLEMKWLARMRETRAVRLTHVGERGFDRLLKINRRTLQS